MLSAILTIGLLAAAVIAAGCFGASRYKHEGRSGLSAIGYTLAAALLCWFLLRTGLERRLLGPAGLFLFASDGVFLPGLAALLLGCVLLCSFFGLTAPGKRLLTGLSAASRKAGVHWLLALASAGLFFLWAMRITVVSFMTNDDTWLLQTAAGTAKYGLSYASGSFSSPLFCGLLGLFYRLDPEGWWYALYHLAILFAACAIVGRCILLRTHRRGWTPLPGLLIHWLAMGGIFFAPLAELSFTVTPAAAGAAAAALILCRDETPSLAGRIASDIGAIVLILLAWLQRRSSGEVVLCFAALACLCRFMAVLRLPRGERKKRLISWAAFVLAGIAAYGVCVGAHRAVSHPGGYTDADIEYSNAEYYRSMVMDYLGPSLTAEDLEAVGIPPELGNLLIKRWYFMDRRVNTDTFRAITELYYHPEDTAEDAAGLWETLKSSYMDSTFYLPAIYLLTAASGVFVLLSAAQLLRQGKRRWPEFLGCLFALGGAAILCAYAMWEGRFLYRVFLLTAIPALVVQLLSCLAIPEGSAPKKGSVWTAVIAAGTAALCVLSVLTVTHIPYAGFYADRAYLFSSQWETEAYASARPDTHFVTNFFAQNLDPFHGGTYPSNMGLWGGSGVTALPDEDRMFAEDFFREDVRFMCENPGTVMMLLQYLTLDNGPVAALDEAHLTDSIWVFDLDRITPGEGVTGWYDAYGKTYYFREGQAVSGSQTIDGETYDFLEPGQKAVMLPIVSDTDAGYITTAYTLAAAP